MELAADIFCKYDFFLTNKPRYIILEVKTIKKSSTRFSGLFFKLPDFIIIDILNYIHQEHVTPFKYFLLIHDLATIIVFKEKQN